MAFALDLNKIVSFDFYHSYIQSICVEKEDDSDILSPIFIYSTQIRSIKCI